jgi:hypothetical protein
VEAASAVIAACSEGLALSTAARHEAPSGKAPARRGAGRSTDEAWQTLRDHPADGLFRLAWGQIDRDKVLAAACAAQSVS